MKRPYSPKKRGDFLYYQLNRESGLDKSDGVTWPTTGCKDRGYTVEFVKDLLAADHYPDDSAKPGL